MRQGSPTSAQDQFLRVCEVSLVAALLLASAAQSQEKPKSQPPIDQVGVVEWGPRNEDGLQCRLQSLQPAWRLGQTPCLEAEVRNAGTRSWSIIQAVNELEINGVWYRGRGAGSGKHSPFSPGRSYQQIPISLNRFLAVTETVTPLLLVRGKYTVRAAFVAGEDLGHFKRGKPSQFVSNPVHFTIGDGPVGESEPLPLTLRLEARIVATDGKPFTHPQISLWKAMDPTAVVVPSEHPPSPIDPGPRRWEDRVTGKTWDLVQHRYVDGDRSTMSGLSFGDYRVTAWVSLGAKLRPWEPTIGVSGVIHLDGRQPKTVELIRLDAGPSLTLNFVDVTTSRKVEIIRFVLTRPDGLPMVPWIEGRWSTWSRGDRFTYPRLVPGRYTLQVDGSPTRYGDANYMPEQDPIAVEIPKDRDTQLTVKLKSVPLAEAEIRRRWPWVVTGKVTDSQGKPLEGVTVYVNRNFMEESKTQTDKDGRYIVRFTVDGHMFDKGRNCWLTIPRAVIVLPFKPGMAERDLYEQGEVMVAEQVPPPYGLQGKKPADFVLPDQPRRIDFVMVPAVTLEGRLRDASGSAVADTYVGLRGDTFPPSRSFRGDLGGMRTDAEGRFHIDAVPVNRAWWLTTRVSVEGRWRDVRTPPFVFASPGRYKIDLEHSKAGPPGGFLQIATFTDEQGAEVRDTLLRAAEK